MYLVYIIHSDLKPANVMLSHTGHVKVTDFGLAKRLLSVEQVDTEAQTLTELIRTGSTLGTLAYMSPEQAGLLNLKKITRSLHRPPVAIPAAVALITLVILGVWFFNHQAKVRWPGR